MFEYSTGIRNIKRQKSKSLINILISIVIVLLLNVYFGNISSIKRQLSELPDAIPVTARVSNLNGSLTSGIAIKNEMIEGIKNSPYIKSPVFTILLGIGLGELPTTDVNTRLNLVGLGCNDIKGISGLQESELSWLPDSEKDFFTSNIKECFIENAILEENNMKVGDTITLTTYYYHYVLNGTHEIRLEPLVVQDYKIVATMDMHDYQGTSTPPNVIIPFGTVEEAFLSQGLTFMPDSAFFTVKKPFELNELKKEMKALGFLQVSSESEFQYDGNALIINDDTFIQAAEQLEESLTLLNVGLPLIIIIVAFIGYISAYLMIQNRKSEYAIMRSVGVKHAEAFRILFFENALLQLLGSIVGSLMAFLVVVSNLHVIGLVIAMFLVFYLTGTSVALWNLGRLSVMDVLTKHE